MDAKQDIDWLEVGNFNKNIPYGNKINLYLSSNGYNINVIKLAL